MTLLQWDDASDAGEGGVWVEVTVRALVERHTLRHKGYREALLSDKTLGPWTIDLMRSAQLGLPVECPCGKAAVRFDGDTVFPFGKRAYGLDGRGEPRDLRVEGQYCPSCDGGEDQG